LVAKVEDQVAAEASGVGLGEAATDSDGVVDRLQGAFSIAAIAETDGEVVEA
jgi:hypothetical protein